MKIAFFLDMPKGLGGAGTLLLKQAKLMSELHEVIVVVPCDEDNVPNDEYVRRCKRNNLKYAVLPYVTAFNFHNVDYLDALKSSEMIEQFAVNENIDFFHTAQLNIAVEHVSRKLGIPHLMDIYRLKKEEFKISYGDLYPQYHLCDSRLYSDLWHDEMGMESRCIRPIAPLDKIMDKVHSFAGKFRIIMLGGVFESKGQLEAIKAIEKNVNRLQMELVIAGELYDDYAAECQRYVKEHGLNKIVRFAGFLSDVSNALKEADCFLCASTEESFPSSIVEAVTYGLPIVTTPVDGVPELFKDGYNAFVSDDFSVEEIGRSINDCMKAYESGFIAQIFENEKLTWETYFSPKTIQQQIEDYYQYITDNFVPRKTGISDIRAEVEHTAQLLQSVPDEEKIVERRCLYYTLLRKQLKSGKAYIWGAGKYGRIAKLILNRIRPDVEIIAYVDGMKKGDYMGIPIISPGDMIFEGVNYIFIGFYVGQDEAIEYLKQMGFGYNERAWIVP